MRSAHRVEVKLFHQLDVTHHIFFADHMAGVRLMFMAVDPFDQQRFAVDTELAVHDFDHAHTDLAAFDLRDMASRILKA